MWIKKVPHVNIDMASSLDEIDKFTDNVYDVIVSDNLLSDGTAKDVVTKVQASTLLKNTPVLIYTGTVENLSLSELKSIGNVIDILPKPFEMNTFVQKLQMLKKIKAS